MENEFVRVLETRIEPGQKTAVHTHEWPATYYVLSWSHFVRRDGEGNVTVDSREKNIMLEPGTAAWSESLPPHSFENVGDAPVHIVSFELKNR